MTQQPGGAKRIGDYELREKLGTDGETIAYGATDLATKRAAVLAVLAPAIARDGQKAREFLAKARSMARLESPYVARTYDAGQDRGIYYMATESLDGPSLETMLQQQGKLPVGTALEFLTQAAHALQAIHAEGLTHGDVRPGNLHSNESMDALKLGGMHTAQHSGAPAGQDDLAFASAPYYMAPERGQGLLGDIRSDIYSLGATFYHALAGAPPFTGPHATAVLMMHAGDTPESLSSLDAAIPKKLDRVIARMMAKSPGDRYESPSELLEALASAKPSSGAATKKKQTSLERRVSKGTQTGTSPVAGKAPPNWPLIIGGAVAAAVAVVVLAMLMLGDDDPVVERATKDLTEARQLLTVGGFDAVGRASKLCRDLIVGLPTSSRAIELATQAERIRDRAEYKFIDLTDEEIRRLVIRARDSDAAVAGLLAKMGEVRRRYAEPGIPARYVTRANELLQWAQKSVEYAREASAEAAAEEEVAAQNLTDASPKRTEPRRTEPADETGDPYISEGLLQMDELVASAEARPEPEPELETSAVPDEAPDPAAELLPILLTGFDDLVKKGAYSEAREMLDVTARHENYTSIASTLRHAIRVLDALEERQRTIVESVRGLVGRTVTLQTAKGVRKGEILEVSDSGIELETKIIINGREKGTTRITLNWCDLTAAERARFAEPWKADTPDARVALVYIALEQGDTDELTALLTALAGHPLAAHLRELTGGAQNSGAEAAARDDWLRIETWGRIEDLGPKDGATFLSWLQQYEDDHGTTKFAASIAKEIVDLKLKGRRASRPAPVGGLVAWWKLDESSGRIASDASGNANDGRFVELPSGLWEPTRGHTGGALHFDDGQGHVNCGSNESLDVSSLTVALWVNADARRVQCPIDRLPLDSGAGWAIRLRPNGAIWFRLGMEPGKDTRDNYGPAGSYSAGEWVHIAATFDGVSGDLALFVNGAEVHRAHWPGKKLDAVGVPLLLATTNMPSKEPFQGRLDDVRIYDRVLSNEEILTLAKTPNDSDD